MSHALAPMPDFAELPVSHLAPVRPKDPQPGDTSPGLLAVLDVTLPGTVSPGNAYGAATGHTVIDDYYDTIHVRPTELPVGNITARVVRQVEVWSAYFEPRRLDQVIITNGEGIELNGPGLPHDFGPLASTLFVLEVGTDGPATVNARYDLVFATPEADPHWRVTGQRIIEWSVPPNWQRPFEETLSYKTEVITAFDGSEQRIALRHLPRRQMEFAPLFDGRQGRTARRLLATWQARTYAMADWAQGVKSYGVPAGGQTVSLSEPIPGLSAGELVSLRSGEQSQVIEVETISANGLTLTLNSPVARAFPVGTKVYPARVVHAGLSAPSRRLTSDVATASIGFTEMHRPGLLDAGAPGLAWRGLEVYLTKPNWADSPTHDHEYPFVWIDTGRGAFDYRTPEDSPKDIRRVHYTLEGREAAASLKRFFARCRGRRGEFYAPTWDQDLIPVADTLLEGSFQLLIDDEREIRRPDNDRVYRNICVRLRDGTVLLRHVVTGEMSQIGSALILGEGWPRNIDRREILAIHYMPRWRMASDDLTISWVTDRLAQATLAWQTLRDV